MLPLPHQDQWFEGRKRVQLILNTNICNLPWIVLLICKGLMLLLILIAMIGHLRWLIHPTFYTTFIVHWPDQEIRSLQEMNHRVIFDCSKSKNTLISLDLQLYKIKANLFLKQKILTNSKNHTIPMIYYNGLWKAQGDIGMHHLVFMISKYFRWNGKRSFCDTLKHFSHRLWESIAKKRLSALTSMIINR